VIGGELGEGTGGVTESLRRRIVLPLGGPLADTDHVIGHELVHAFQFDIASSENERSDSRAERLPLWFIEGMAEYLSIGPVDPHTSMWLRDATRREKLPAIEDLDNPQYFPYRWGQAVWAYVAGRWGDEVVGRLLPAAASLGVDKAIEQVLGLDTKQLSSDWHASIVKTYTPALTAPSTAEAARLVIEGGDLGADLNVAPALSPDGRWLAFLSTRGFFSVDLYLADAATGRVVRRLTSTATSPHFSSIQFIHSAGAWDAASRRIAVATVVSGRAALAIFDAQDGSLSREITVREVDEILNPTWAPDGRAVAFTGLHQGLTDLFVYDLDGGRLRQLTHDPYADIQPAWSPDGRRIAFATDRFTTDLDTLAIGRYRLGLIDPQSGAIEPVVTSATGGKQINPQWSPDGGSLYFISDREGISNLYRTSIGSDPATEQLTTLPTGVSGITASSPALSVSSGKGVVAFTAYEDGKYHIATLEPDARGVAPRVIAGNAAVLPPGDRAAGSVSEMLASPTTGLPAPAEYPVEPYRAGLALEGIAQPVVGVGVSRLGTSFGGGISLTFSDQLRNHVLATAVQIGSTVGGGTGVRDIGAQVAYLNMKRRWNWGVIGGQVPYLSGGYSSTVGVLRNRDLVQTDQLYVFRQTERSASGVVSYPFDRAQRVELQGGATSISFDQIVRTTTYSLYTGALYEDSIQTTPLGQTLNLGTGSAAYVFDTSVSGPTSPVQGQRYRFETAPTFGTINFAGVLADYRRYFMPASFYTFAVRGMHYGRYGSGSEDGRIFPLYVGYPWLVRGYDIGSIAAPECVATATSSCEIIDRLLGSRMLVGNLEFRFPLLRPFGVSSNMYGPVPVEVALFADGGAAWTRSERPSILGGTRRGVSSAGVAFRLNLFGFAVVELDAVRAFQRPGRGWILAFNFMPGW
jgi:hypothetical protein